MAPTTGINRGEALTGRPTALRRPGNQGQPGSCSGSKLTRWAASLTPARGRGRHSSPAWGYASSSRGLGDRKRHKHGMGRAANCQWWVTVSHPYVGADYNHALLVGSLLGRFNNESETRTVFRRGRDTSRTRSARIVV